VGRFLGDLNVVHVRFTHTGGSDFHELRLVAHVFNSGATAVTHGGADAAYQLVDDGQHTALVGYTAFDAFRHELVGVVGRVLEVAVGRAFRHGPQAAHTTVGLVRPTLVENHFTRRLFRTGKHAAHHAGRSPCSQSLGNITGETDTA